MRHNHRPLKFTPAIGAICLLLASCAAADATPERVMSINESRLLIACETEPDVFADFSQPMDWAGFAERDLMLFDISDNVHRVTRYGNEVEKRLVSEEEEAFIIRLSDCRADDKYVLVGKDGGVKRRWTGKLSIDELFQTIDAMPMRQYEMRERSGN